MPKTVCWPNRAVVYFDQHLGAAHAKRWSKYTTQGAVSMTELWTISDTLKLVKMPFENITKIQNETQTKISNFKSLKKSTPMMNIWDFTKKSSGLKN